MYGLAVIPRSFEYYMIITSTGDLQRILRSIHTEYILRAHRDSKYYKYSTGMSKWKKRHSLPPIRQSELECDLLFHFDKSPFRC